jgi:hypothetical protein
VPANDRRQPAAAAYRQAQLDARKVAGEIGAQSLRDIQAAIRKYADQLGAELKKLDPALQFDAIAAVSASRDVVLLAASRLENKLAQIVKEHRAASFAEIQGIWQEAGLAAAHAVGVPNALLGAVRSPHVTLAGAYEALGSAGKTWRTLITGHSANAAGEADALIRQGLLTGMDVDTLARGLRDYSTALSPSVRAAFAGASPTQLAAMEAAARETSGGLKMLRFNASRIAISETHNARAEAELTHFAADPLVDAVFWRLSPSRGKLSHPDACDVLASMDMYGLGPGCFPIAAVPLPPHPHDRCERVPRVRPWAEAGEEKPNPPRIWVPGKSAMDLKQVCFVD